MKVFLLLACVLSLLFLPLSAQPSYGLQVVESLSLIPVGWVKSKAASPTKLMKFRLAIHQANAAKFEQQVTDIATPGHENYSKFLSREQLKAALRPDPQVVKDVFAWLSSAKVPARDIKDDGNGWISFVVSVSKAEDMMDTTFSYYYHKAHDMTVLRTLQYSVPRAIHPYVQMIQPTTRFGKLGPHLSSLSTGDVVEATEVQPGYNATFCNTMMTPDCVRGLYGFDKFTADPSVAGNMLGISGYLGFYAQYADLALFYSKLTGYNSADNFSVVSISDGVNTQSPASGRTIEGNLDVQYGLSLSHGIPSVYYTTGGNGPLITDLDEETKPGTNEPYLDQLHYLLGLDSADLPTVLTTSYGEDEQSIPAPYTNATCALFAQLGARGVSVIFSSGDVGVSSACMTNDGTNTTRFLPIFPASCPFVTAVGGTQGVEPERAASFSSGGFSDRFARPAWQEAAVAPYLHNLMGTWGGYFNPAGRAFPDVAAQADNFVMFDQGVMRTVWGTSCSAPVFAAIITNLNNIRLKAGHPALGFLNPWLYASGYQGLTDIVEGGSKGCDGTDDYTGVATPVVPYASWNATVGWDPVTGLGTPRFGVLAKMVLNADLVGQSQPNGPGTPPWEVWVPGQPPIPGVGGWEGVVERLKVAVGL